MEKILKYQCPDCENEWYAAFDEELGADIKSEVHCCECPVCDKDCFPNSILIGY
jgi:hypothetical protein